MTLDGDGDSTARERAALALVQVIRWMATVDARHNPSRAVRTLAARVCVAAYALGPDYTGTLPLIARSLGLSPNRLSEHAAEFSRRFGLFTANQRAAGWGPERRPGGALVQKSR
jgi:hypothetical protein